MYVPIVPHVKVVNNQVFYSDTVLPVKDLGSNIKVSTISSVGEDSLERCLKIIFESNPDVVFNTIQYSKNDKKVYFYTDKEIITKVYEESKFTKYKPLTSSLDILEEIKKVLVLEKDNSSDCVSLFDVGEVLKKFHNDYEGIKKRYNSKFKSIVKENFSDSSNIIIYNFDYENKLLKIGFKRWDFSDYQDIYFTKENNDLYIIKTSCLYAKELFNVLSSDLSSLYDEFISFNDYKDYKKAKYDIKAVNSNFKVNISHYGVGIFVKSQSNPFLNDFSLFVPSYDDKYSLDCNSSVVQETLKGKEEEIFKRIFVRIDDCPSWCQSILYEVRQKQLLEEKKPKRLELIKKFLILSK